MIAEEELRRAIEAGKRFQQAVQWVKYDDRRDMITLGTPWGDFTIKREAVPVLRDVPRERLAKVGIETSPTAVHIEELDLDINSAGLLANLFQEIEGQLTY
jgi:hypothetical protein